MGLKHRAVPKREGGGRYTNYLAKLHASCFQHISARWILAGRAKNVDASSLMKTRPRRTRSQPKGRAWTMRSSTLPVSPRTPRPWEHDRDLPRGVLLAVAAPTRTPPQSGTMARYDNHIHDKQASEKPCADRFSAQDQGSFCSCIAGTVVPRDAFSLGS